MLVELVYGRAVIDQSAERDRIRDGAGVREPEHFFNHETSIFRDLREIVEQLLVHFSTISYHVPLPCRFEDFRK